MRTLSFSFLFVALLGLSFSAVPTAAVEKAPQKATKTGDVKDAEKVKASAAFLVRWQRIQKVTRQRAYEVQQTRTGAGVRGNEAEDTILDRLYYRNRTGV